jgi:hypothetical protein
MAFGLNCPAKQIVYVEKKRRWGQCIHQLRASSFGSESLVRKIVFLIAFAHEKVGHRERRGRS